MKAYPRMMYFGALHHDVLLGYVLWVEKGGFRSKAVLELEQIAVEPEHRGRGTGTKLIRDSLAQVRKYLDGRKASPKLIEVTTGVNNPAKRLYQMVLGAKEQFVIPDFYEEDESIMIARTTDAMAGRVETNKELLQLEYEQCQWGYNSRDAIIPSEFGYMVVILGVLIGALGFLVDKFDTNPILLRAAAAIVGVAGMIAFWGFFTDLLSNCSTRLALRKRSVEIENELSPQFLTDNSFSLRLWRDTIPNRHKVWSERMLKRLTHNKTHPEREIEILKMAGWLIIFLWLTMVALVGVYGPNI
jgi:GNAT superfamily N-acetyltransferase